MTSQDRTTVSTLGRPQNPHDPDHCRGGERDADHSSAPSDQVTRQRTQPEWLLRRARLSNHPQTFSFFPIGLERMICLTGGAIGLSLHSIFRHRAGCAKRRESCGLLHEDWQRQSGCGQIKTTWVRFSLRDCGINWLCSVTARCSAGPARRVRARHNRLSEIGRGLDRLVQLQPDE